MHRLIAEQPGVAEITKEVEALGPAEAEATAAAAEEWEDYEAALRLAARKGLPLPTRPASNPGSIAMEFRSRRDVLLRIREEKVAEQADTIWADIVTEQDRVLDEAKSALEALDRAAGALNELRGAAGEVGQIVAGVTDRPSEVPLYGGKSRPRVDLIALVHALRLGKRFVGDPVLTHPQVHDQILSGAVPQHLKVGQP